MSFHALLQRDTLLAAWHVLRPPILAIAVTVALRLAGWRSGRVSLGLAAAAAAVGLAAGWLGLFGVPGSLHALLTSHAVADRLRLAALVVALICLVAPLLQLRPPLISGLLALLGGWWMSGAPVREPELWRDGMTLVVTAAVLWLACRSAEERALQPLAAAVMLVLALGLAGAAPLWIMLALVPAACAVAALVGPPGAGALLPVGCGVVLAAVAVEQAAGRIAEGRFGVLDAACLSPLVPILLIPRLERLGPLAAAAIATVIGLGGVALVARAAVIL